VQGVGSVGRRLVKHLCDAGAQVIISDIFPDRLAVLAEELRLETLGADDIYQADVDVFSPCALGGILNNLTIPQLRAGIVAGAANNQLLKPEHGKQLLGRRIVYVPDYAINAGGVIDIATHQLGLSYEQSMSRVAGIYDTISKILRRAKEENTQPELIANRMAEENFL
jgi:leucine dehydrogenase